ncbi:uncharacterized protein LOC101853471 [Aplysia californica]|uniref:Uncharacterized protein LOC101853471 n=1 Tax=Aplysia californica TaxID=6500 RepID=A0ABM1A3P6_APLCA|nr:uncharacterized protein LOC101853471 [Aplysia californica]
MAGNARNLFIFAILLKLAMTSAQSSLYVDLRLTPEVVVPYTTPNVTLKCTTSSRTPNYYGRAQQSTKQLVRMRILRGRGSGSYHDNWETLAYVSDTDSSPHTMISDIVATGKIVDSKYSSSSSELTITWPKANARTFGTFICDGVVYTETSAELTRSSQKEIGKDLKGVDVTNMLEAESAKVIAQVEENNNAIQEQLKNLTEEIKETLTAQNQQLLAMESDLRGVVESGFLLYWPEGSYALLEPNTGCPSDNANVWEKGYIRHHSESTDRNKDAVSTTSNLQTPALSREDSQNYATEHFCVKTSGNTVGPKWPRGSYCINKKEQCPGGFQEGFVYIDEEDNEQNPFRFGVLPNSNYSDSGTRLDYCCRSDGSSETEIYLPTNRPFYLYRRGGQCQRVHHMTVSPEFLTIDSENTDNNDKRGGAATPDVQINNIQIELCYYKAR